MANTNAPFGFSQYSGTGSSPTYEQVQLAISSTNSTNPQIFSGDPVAQLSTGYICQVGTNSTTSANAAAAGSMIGIFAGCKYLSVSQKRTVWSNYFPGVGDVNTATAVTAYVITDPNAQFLVADREQQHDCHCGWRFCHRPEHRLRLRHRHRHQHEHPRDDPWQRVHRPVHRLRGPIHADHAGRHQRHPAVPRHRPCQLYSRRVQPAPEHQRQ